MAIELPDPNDREAVREFAASFNGYEHRGSFAACADAAAKKKRNSLVDLRNELFFAYRAANHQGDSGFVETYRELLPFFRRFVDEE